MPMMQPKMIRRVCRLPLTMTMAACLAISFAVGPALADDARLHTFHCLAACPIGAPENADLIVREIYTLTADPFTKFATWVAYRVTPATIGPSQSRNWTADPWLDAVETLEPQDYDGSSAALGTDRGHQAPLAAFSGTAFWPETNMLSNITPQASALNQGAWQRLEARETRLAKDENVAVYVLTGPLFERLMPRLPNSDERHRVPSGYWKVVMTADGRGSAFLFDQSTDKNADYCSALTDLEQVELRARLRLLPMRTAPLANLAPALGCMPPPAPRSPAMPNTAPAASAPPAPIGTPRPN